MRFIALALLLSLVSYCAPLRILVSIPPQLEAIRSIAPEASVTSLVPAGASPETYAPKPKDLKKIRDVDVFFTIGVPMEKAILPKIKSMYPKLRIIDTTEGMSFRDIEEHHHEEEHEEESDHMHSGKDPHVWLSIDNMLVHAKCIEKNMEQLDGKNAEAYRNNLLKYNRKLLALKSEISSKLTSFKNASILVFHPAYGYFLDEYSIKQISIEKHGKEAGGAHIAEVLDTAKQINAKALFAQPQSNPRTVKSAAAMLKLPVYILDPMADPYSDNIAKIADTIYKQALNKR